LTVFFSFCNLVKVCNLCIVEKTYRITLHAQVTIYTSFLLLLSKRNSGKYLSANLYDIFVCAGVILSSAMCEQYCLLRSPVSAIDTRVQLHIGDVSFFLYDDHFLTFGATFFFSGATFSLLARLFFPARLFSFRATFYFWRDFSFLARLFFFRCDFFSLARLCRPLPDLLWAQSTKKCG